MPFLDELNDHRPAHSDILSPLGLRNSDTSGSEEFFVHPPVERLAVYECAVKVKDDSFRPARFQLLVSFARFFRASSALRLIRFQAPVRPMAFFAASTVERASSRVRIVPS